MAGGDVPYLGLLHPVVLGLSREDKDLDFKRM